MIFFFHLLIFFSWASVIVRLSPLSLSNCPEYRTNTVYHTTSPCWNQNFLFSPIFKKTGQIEFEVSLMVYLEGIFFGGKSSFGLFIFNKRC